MRQLNILNAIALITASIICAPVASHAQVAGGVDEIVRELGFSNEISVTKSVAAMGALLSVARAKLPEREYLQLLEALPGTERVIAQASNVLAGELPTDMAGAANAYERLSLQPAAVVAHRKFILEYLGKNGGRKIVPSLQKAWSN